MFLIEAAKYNVLPLDDRRVERVSAELAGRPTLIQGNTQLLFGSMQVRAEFAHDGGGYGKGGNVTLFLDGTQVGADRVDGTVPMIFSLDETTDIGRDTATSITDDLSVEETGFNGSIQWIQIDVGADAKDADNYISAEERFRIAMAIHRAGTQPLSAFVC